MNISSTTRTAPTAGTHNSLTPSFKRNYRVKVVQHLGLSLFFFLVSLAMRVFMHDLPWTPLAISAYFLARGWYENQRWRAVNQGIICYSHSDLLYYWPVWLFAFLAADFTLFWGVDVAVGATETMRVAASPLTAVTFALIIAFVVVTENVHLRGVWVIVIGAVAAFTLLALYHFGLLSRLSSFTSRRAAFISREFYLLIGTCLFIPWLLVVFWWDRRKYVHIEPNTLTVVREIGDGEMSLDNIGVSFEKRRDNFFQHRLIGLGSGDLVITPSGRPADAVVVPNIFAISHVIRQIREIHELRGKI